MDKSSPLGASWPRIVPLMAFIVLLIVFAIGLTRDPRVLPSQLIDRDMPAFTLPGLGAGAATVSEADLLGETSLVNVFGSWCAACLVEHDMLMAIGERRDIQLIGLNWRDSDSDVTAWLSRHGNPYDLIAVDVRSELAIELGVTGAPETFLVGPDGRIRYKHTGPITPDIWRETLLPLATDLVAREEVS